MDDQNTFTAGLISAAALVGAIISWVVKPIRADRSDLTKLVDSHDQTLREDHVHRTEFDGLRDQVNRLDREHAALNSRQVDVLRRLDALEKRGQSL